MATNSSCFCMILEFNTEDKMWFKVRSYSRVAIKHVQIVIYFLYYRNKVIDIQKGHVIFNKINWIIKMMFIKTNRFLHVLVNVLHTLSHHKCTVRLIACRQNYNRLVYITFTLIISWNKLHWNNKVNQYLINE